MRYGIAAALLALGAASGSPVFAGPAGGYVQPAVYFKASFGGARAPDLGLGLRADYADGVHRQLAAPDAATPAQRAAPALVRLPALFEAQWSADSVALSENGMPIASRSLRLAENDDGHSGNWGLNLGLALAATGAALALIVASAGHAAQENNPAVTHGNGSTGVGTGGSGGGTCQVQVGSNCVSGGG